MIIEGYFFSYFSFKSYVVKGHNIYLFAELAKIIPTNYINKYSLLSRDLDQISQKGKALS